MALAAALWGGCATTPQPLLSQPETANTGVAVQAMRRESQALQPLVRSRWAQQFVQASGRLPSIAPRKLHYTPDKLHYYTQSEADALPPTTRQGLFTETVDEEGYYYAGGGSPLAYARLLDIISEGEPTRAELPGRRMLDFGYGSIGQLRILASLGVDAVGLDVSPRLRALYGGPSDQGQVAVPGREVLGRVSLVHGRFPHDPAVRAAVGQGYDLIFAKNVLSRGFVHPAASYGALQDAAGPGAATAPAAVDLGVSDEEFVRSLFELLKSGGRLLIYNMHTAPASSTQPYRPQSDGRSPFSRALFEGMGFRVIAFERNDTPAVRELGRALAWDAATNNNPFGGTGRLDLENDLFASYTLLEKP